MHIDPSSMHPELQKAGTLIRLIVPSFSERKFRLATLALSAMKGKCRRPLKYEQVFIPRGDKSLLRLCVYSPLERREHVPGLLWLHGGGYGLGTPEQSEAMIERFIRISGCVVVSPDYRLSIDAPYPAALEDSYAALLWLKNHGSEYGMRDDQLMVGGESSGGGLAAAVTLYARDTLEAAIAFQMPLYPMLDDRMNTPSATNNDAPVWNSKSNDIAWRLYLGDLFGKSDVPAYAAPARCSDFTGLPPACSFVGSIEPFCDETVRYMENLRVAGIPAQYKVFDGCFHGFDIVAAKSKVAIEAMDLLETSFRYATEHYFAAQPAGESRGY